MHHESKLAKVNLPAPVTWIATPSILSLSGAEHEKGILAAVGRGEIVLVTTKINDDVVILQ